MSKTLAERVREPGFAEAVERHRAKLDAEDHGWVVMEPARARALLAVARAAEAVRLWSCPVDMQRSDFLSEEHAQLNTRTPVDARLHRSLARLARVSSRPSTVEGKRKPVSNSSRPGRENERGMKFITRGRPGRGRGK